MTMETYEISDQLNTIARLLNELTENVTPGSDLGIAIGDAGNSISQASRLLQISRKESNDDIWR